MAFTKGGVVSCHEEHVRTWLSEYMIIRISGGTLQIA